MIRLDELARIDAIVIVGSSCAGKSTLVDAVRASPLCATGVIDVPVRYVTRPLRANDNTVENRHISAADLDAMVQRGEIGVHWRRRMEGDRDERYGFALPRAGALPVYSGNNALLAQAAKVGRLPAGFSHACFIGVHAPTDVREARLRRRSPDLAAAEVRHRLAGDLDTSLVHFLVENHGAREASAPDDVLSLVRSLATRSATLHDPNGA